MKTFNTEHYILTVRERDKSPGNPGHEQNVLDVLRDMIIDGAPLWAIKSFLEFVS